MDKFEENIKLLRDHDPALARRVESVGNSESVHVSLSKDGLPVARLGSVSLHSAYRPREEAVRAVSGHVCCGGDESLNVIYGLGFGYHVEEMLKRFPSGAVTVIEPAMEIFRAFVANIDLKPFLPRTRFLIAEPPPRILARLAPGDWRVMRHLPSVRVAQGAFGQLESSRELAGFLKSNSLKILVVNPIYGGSLPTAKYCARALENLGHRVASVECDKFADGFLSLAGITGDKQNAKVLAAQFMNFMGEMIAARAADFCPDLILSLAQAPLTPAAIQRLRALRIPIAFWFVEDFRTLPYWKEIAASYDHFFTIQRGEFLDQLKSHGAHDVYYLPQGCFPDVHRPLELTPEERKTYGADLSFMGAAYYNRRQTFPRLLRHDFKIWGTGWRLESPVGERVQNENRRVSSEESVKIYNGARINLNLHSSTYHEGVHPEGDFVNPRTFEIAAAAGFQLVDERSELKELFRVGDEMITFVNIEDLKEKIAYYLARGEERNSIAQNSRIRVLAEHTLESRMTEMLIRVFAGRFEFLKQRIAERKEPLDVYIEQAGENTGLAQYLERFRGQPEFTLKTAVDHIGKGEGALTKTETLMLMVNQLVRDGK